MTTQPTGASATGPGLVEVTGLTKSYRSTPALRDYNLSLEAGHIVGLMGPNGCGKTTLLKILAGVLSDYRGTVTIDGHAPGVATKAIVSYLPDADFLNTDWTAADAIRVYSLFFSDFDADKAASMIDFFALPTDRRLSEMSKGMGRSSRSASSCPGAPACTCSTSPSAASTRRRATSSSRHPARVRPRVAAHYVHPPHLRHRALRRLRALHEGRTGPPTRRRRRPAATHGDSLDAIFRKEYR